MSRHPEHTRWVTTADGVRLAVTQIGAGRTTGPAVLLVHGFAQNRRTFTLGALPAGFVACGARVFVAELRGHGDSQRPATAWDLSTHLELDLPAILDAVAGWSGGPVHYQGHSMGGMLGYLLLARSAPIASLVTYCAPLILGVTRPAVRAAAFLLGPPAARLRSVPVDRLLRIVAGPLTYTRAVPGLRAVQRYASLVNPGGGVPDRLRLTLATADPESPLVVRQMAKMAVSRRPELLGVDMARAVAAARIPLCAVVGTDDVFAPPASVARILAPPQAGRRRLIQIPGGSHVDVPMGHDAGRLAEDVWRFIESA